MKKSQYMKNALLASVLMIGLRACKKKEEAQEPTTTATSCFNSQYNGTYTGSGFSAFSPYTSGTLVITKTGCSSLSLSLNTNTSYNFTDNITQVVLSGSGGYTGKQSNGNNITIVLGSSLNVNAVGSFTFSGTK